MANVRAARGQRVMILTEAQNVMAAAYAVGPQVERREVGWAGRRIRKS
jgi:hypothetical protein